MEMQWNEDDLFYVCTMIEFVARETHNLSLIHISEPTRPY